MATKRRNAMLRELNENEMEMVSGGECECAFGISSQSSIEGYELFVTNWGDWLDQITYYEDTLYAQGLNANMTDGIAYAFIEAEFIGIDENGDGTSNYSLYLGDVVSGVDADNNGQIDMFEDAGLIAQDSVISG
jgi:hypothetical protein